MRKNLSSDEFPSKRPKLGILANKYRIWSTSFDSDPIKEEQDEGDFYDNRYHLFKKVRPSVSSQCESYDHHPIIEEEEKEVFLE